MPTFCEQAPPQASSRPTVSQQAVDATSFDQLRLVMFGQFTQQIVIRTKHDSLLWIAPIAVSPFDAIDTALITYYTVYDGYIILVIL
jgi:hypothetical protein